VRHDQLTNAAACRRFGWFHQRGQVKKTSPQLPGTASSIQRSPYMSLRGDSYRQRADDAKHRAAQAKDLSIKSAFEHVAAVWAALAEQVERIDTDPLRDEENNHSVR